MVVLVVAIHRVAGCGRFVGKKWVLENVTVGSLLGKISRLDNLMIFPHVKSVFVSHFRCVCDLVTFASVFLSSLRRVNDCIDPRDPPTLRLYVGAFRPHVDHQIDLACVPT